MTSIEQLRAALLQQKRTWLITGVAGFIGSNLLERLLQLGQQVIGIDNFATGYRRNLEEVRDVVAPSSWKNFMFIEGDIRNPDDCRAACRGADYVLHQAALGSVPRSIDNPSLTASTNLMGFLNILVAARDAEVKRFVYASSSSVYGDHAALPKIEEFIGEPLSPYALTKRTNEEFAAVFFRCYGFASIGLRYFNVFGPRQDPGGAYAAVIPRWVAGMMRNETIFINGDGETSRDFCFVENVVQANLLAATVSNPLALNQVYNVALNQRTTLNELFEAISSTLANRLPAPRDSKPFYRDFRSGDVRHSQADISKAATLLGYQATHDVREGLSLAMEWYLENIAVDKALA